MVFWRCINHTFAKKHHLFTYKSRAHFRLFAKKHPLFTSKRRALLRPKITLLRRNTLYLHPRGVHCSFLGIWGGFGEALGGFGGLWEGFGKALGSLWEALGRLWGAFGHFGWLGGDFGSLGLCSGELCAVEYLQEIHAGGVRAPRRGGAVGWGAG